MPTRAHLNLTGEVGEIYRRLRPYLTTIQGQPAINTGEVLRDIIYIAKQVGATKAQFMSIAKQLWDTEK